ncbi:hypothetical protein HYC85_013358 [Camellia sinensis]|uniref:Uncharacterized protein n=1 Tax=Camellia sinensis TaxID=4442 RepID=A0A7J7H587_CAMSI|nr:hypothetical protein HYC85_013358 [Camellia sinensis]
MKTVEIDVPFCAADFLDDEFKTEDKVKNEPGKAHHLPFFLKEENLSEEELQKILEERYKPGSSFVTYAEDKCKTLNEGNAVRPLSSDPTIWKVKCMKYVDKHSLGTELQIISAFTLEHVRAYRRKYLTDVEVEVETAAILLDAHLGGGIASKKIAIPPPRLISSTELE